MLIDNLDSIMDGLGKGFADRAAAHDENDTFVALNWAELKDRKLFSAMVPPELGGGGVAYGDVCRLIRKMASYCSSTALAFSMHQHLVAAATWNYRHGNPGEKLLRRVAEDETVLVSTGANDWLDSGGTLQPCDGGFRYSGSKAFASGCPAGDLLITSGRYNDVEQGWQVLHFPVSLRAEGVHISNNWKAMGMRGTGSHTVMLENVFIPADAVGLRRAMGRYHNAWNIVLTVAVPLISSAYVGVADAAANIAREQSITSQQSMTGADDVTAILLGEMTNALTTALLSWESMVAMVDALNFQPSLAMTSDILARKTIAMQAVSHTANKALEIIGGRGYLRSNGLERLVRDAYAGQFHPLTPMKQQLFTGRLAMGRNVDDGLMAAGANG